MTRIATAAMLAALISSARPFSMVKPPVNRGSSRFFLETADVNEWADLLPLGIFHGVITSPVLLQRVGLRCSVETCRELADQALELGAGEVLLQAWGESTDSLVACALGLHAGEARVVIKVPATATGTRAAAALVRRGVRVCLTGAFGTHQALVAVGVGAEYIAPHLGRLTDSGEDGRAEMAGMLSVIDGVGGKTRVLAAGLRDVEDIEMMASVGVGCVAIRPASARMLVALEPRSEAYAASAEKAASGLVPPGWQRFDPKQAGARGGATTRRALRRGEEEVIELFLEGYDDDDDDGDDDDDDDDDDDEGEMIIVIETIDDFGGNGPRLPREVTLPRLPTAEEMTPGTSANSARAAIAKHFHSERVLTPMAAAGLLFAAEVATAADEAAAADEATAAQDIDTSQALHVVDVRTLAEHNAAANASTHERVTLPGAKWVSLEDIVGGGAYLPSPDAGGALLLVCWHGTTALVALDFLYERFEAIYCLDGGVAAWQAAGMPVRKWADTVADEQSAVDRDSVSDPAAPDEDMELE